MVSLIERLKSIVAILVIFSKFTLGKRTQCRPRCFGGGRVRPPRVVQIENRRFCGLIRADIYPTCFQGFSLIGTVGEHWPKSEKRAKKVPKYDSYLKSQTYKTRVEVVR